MIQIELMKTEIITMCKYDSGGKINYNYPPDMRNKMHDDRAYVYGLLCWSLAQLRRGQIINRPQKQFDYTHAPSCVSTISFDNYSFH